jgi:hypothetical protein
MATKMKIFTTNDPDGRPVGAGGYVIGEGDLPKGFNPDAFMDKLGRKIMSRVLQGDQEALNYFNAELDRAIAQGTVVEGSITELDNVLNNPETPQLEGF